MTKDTRTGLLPLALVELRRAGQSVPGDVLEVAEHVAHDLLYRGRRSRHRRMQPALPHRGPLVLTWPVTRP